MIKLVPVPPQSVEPIWKRLEHDIARACRDTRGTVSPDSVKARAISGHCTIWIVGDQTDAAVTASCVTSVVALPTGIKVMFVEIVCGKQYRDVFDFRATLEKSAASLGCASLFFLIPRGMARGTPLPEYRASHYLMTKELAANG